MQIALAGHDVILRQDIETRGGHVFKTVGDAFAWPKRRRCIGKCWNVPAARTRAPLFGPEPARKAGTRMRWPKRNASRVRHCVSWRLRSSSTARRRAESETALHELIAKHETGGDHQVAEVYGAYGEAAFAFDWLERAPATRWRAHGLEDKSSFALATRRSPVDRLPAQDGS